MKNQVILWSIISTLLCGCAMKFGGVKNPRPYVPQREPHRETFDALCAEGKTGHKAHLDLLLGNITHDYYLLSKGINFHNLKKQQCYLEQLSREPFYYYPRFTKLYFAKCKFNEVVRFEEINLIIKYQGINYKKVQRLLDGKTWILSTDRCAFWEQKKMIPYETLIKKQ